MLIPSPACQKACTNEQLTSEEETEVRRAIDEPLNRLKAIESETARLQDRLIVLRHSKKDAERFIKSHQNLLSSVRRLLPEIIQEIFCQSLPVAHNSVLSLEEAPLLLGRSVAADCLFHAGIVVLAPYRRRSLYFPRAKVRLEAFSRWLARSGTLPLSISLSNAIESRELQYHFLPYFDLIAKHARRWKDIHFQLEPWDPIDSPLKSIVGDLPFLEVFHIRVRGATARSLSEEDGILLAPALRVLSVHDPSLRMVDLPVQWSQLTGLDLIYFNLPDVFKILKCCSNLETFALNVGARRRPLSSSTISPSSNSSPKVILPKLRTLDICEVESTQDNDLLTLLDNLFVPALRHFAYQLVIFSPTPSSDIQLSEPLSPSRVFTSFFQRLNEPLEELDFQAHGCTTKDLMDFLYLLPGLKRLSLRCPFHPPKSSEKSFNDQLLLGFIPYEHRSHCHSCSLFEEPEQAEVHDSVYPSSTCLCPNLEVLQVTSACFSAHVLLEFLRSRLVDYDEYHMARLRRFNISFNSKFEEDGMTEEVDELVEKSGLLVKLEHTLAPTPQPCLLNKVPTDSD